MRHDIRKLQKKNDTKRDQVTFFYTLFFANIDDKNTASVCRQNIIFFCSVEEKSVQEEIFIYQTGILRYIIQTTTD
jgi:hypothetical protein